MRHVPVMLLMWFQSIDANANPTCAQHHHVRGILSPEAPQCHYMYVVLVEHQTPRQECREREEKEMDKHPPKNSNRVITPSSSQASSSFHVLAFFFFLPSPSSRPLLLEPGCGIDADDDDPAVYAADDGCWYC